MSAGEQVSEVVPESNEVKVRKLPNGTKRKAKIFAHGSYVPEVPKEIINQALKAVAALREHTDAKRVRSTLFGFEDEPVFLHLLLKRIPYNDGSKLIRANLRHSFRPPSTSTVCVIVPDDAKDWYTSDIDKNARQFADFLKFEKGVENINLVVSLRQLEREYCTPEAMKKLCSAYDMFIVDNRIISQTSRRIGSCFLRENKAPFPLELRHGNVAARIQNCRAATHLCLYPCNPKACVQVGMWCQTNEQLVDNIKCVLQTLAVKLPAGFTNVRRLQITMGTTLPPLDIFLDLDSGNTIAVGCEKKKMDTLQDNLDNLPEGVNVKVDMNNLNVRIVDAKGRRVNSRRVKKLMEEAEMDDTEAKKKRARKQRSDQVDASSDEEFEVKQEFDSTPIKQEFEKNEKKKKPKKKRKPIKVKLEK